MNANSGNYQKHNERHGFPRHPGGTMPGRVPVFLHGGNPQEAYTMPHAYLVDVWKIIQLRKQKDYTSQLLLYCQSIARENVRKAS